MADAQRDAEYTNPWRRSADGHLRYIPDYDTLVRLLGVPLYLRAATTTGVPALALDVWVAYELRRAGFEVNAVWPRATHPRILPGPIAHLLKKGTIPVKVRAPLEERLTQKGNIKDVTHSSASILGKNYLKQVDVIMTDWATGPELLISTKRMDSSYGKNAPNRIEESYGDAKNLRLRHPLAALGFMFGLRTDIFKREPETADWLFDLLAKLGREEDAYHATCVVLIEYGDELAVPDGEGPDDEDRSVAAGLEPASDGDEKPVELPLPEIERQLAQLPPVRISHDRTPENLSPATFLATIVEHVLDQTPVTMHKGARGRRREAEPAQ